MCWNARDFIHSFIALIKVNREKTGLVPKLTEYAFGFEFVRNKVFEQAKGKVLKLTNGLYPAPLKVSLNENSNFEFYQEIYLDCPYCSVK